MSKRTQTMTFPEALVRAGGHPHLLLGNGFSMALKPDIFSYGSLYEECEKQGIISEELRMVFKKFGTKDFEIIIRALNDASAVLKIYSKKSKLSVEISRDAKKLKTLLVKLLSLKHPENPSVIPEDKYTACVSFLSSFEKIYTLNYDLLLYWTVMKALEAGTRTYDDGFRYAENEDYVVWHPEEAKSQNIYYLHGALHLFDMGAEIQKFTWVNTGITLMRQVKEQLDQNNFPLFVAEGTSPEKMTKINHSQYLGRGVRSFAEIGGSLFIFGHSLGANDSHYLNLIGKNKIEKLFVGLYDDGTNKSKAINKVICQRAENIKTLRLKSRKPRQLDVSFYDAASAKVWG